MHCGGVSGGNELVWGSDSFKFHGVHAAFDWRVDLTATTTTTTTTTTRLQKRWHFLGFLQQTGFLFNLIKPSVRAQFFIIKKTSVLVQTKLRKVIKNLFDFSFQYALSLSCSLYLYLSLSYSLSFLSERHVRCHFCCGSIIK